MKLGRRLLIVFLTSIIAVWMAACSIRPDPQLEEEQTGTTSAGITAVKPETSATSTQRPTTAPPMPTLTGSPIPLPELAGTLVLYTAVQQDHFALHTLPAGIWSGDTSVFSRFYGDAGSSRDVSLYLSNFRPQLSPDGRYLLLPGIGGYAERPEHPNTGLWLADLSTGTLRQLLPQVPVMDWSPDSSRITYVEGDTLYVLAIQEGATPQALFSHPDLARLFARWSPDGRYIAVVTAVTENQGAGVSLKLTDTYWLVSPSDGTAQELVSRPGLAMERIAHELSWSADGQLLLINHREVIDLNGETVATLPGAASWLPSAARLLVNGSEGLRWMTPAGETIATLSEERAMAFALSASGGQLAYALQSSDDEATLFVVNLVSMENMPVTTVAADHGYVALLRWSADESVLLADDGRPDSPIWLVEVQSGVARGGRSCRGRAPKQGLTGNRPLCVLYLSG